MSQYSAALSTYRTVKSTNDMISLRVVGAQGLATRFYAADGKVQAAGRRLVRDMGEFCKELTKFFCPVDTRFMQDHVRTTYTRDGLGWQTGWYREDFAAAGLTFYPPFQEFGTRKMRAQPSLFPAYRQTETAFRPKVKDFYRKALERSLRGSGGR